MTTRCLESDFDPGNGVATLTFNRPEVLNAINMAMADEFRAAVTELKSKPGLRCIVLTGAGRAFMAGGDIASFGRTPEQARQTINALLDALNPAIMLLRSIEAPVIAAVNGAAAGAGLSLALMADLIVADENARFMVGYNGLGTTPDCGGTWFLHHKIGSTRSAEMMMLNRTLSAAEAKNWGLITEVAPEGQFEYVKNAMVKQVASGPTKAFSAFRRLTDQVGGQSLETHLELERQAFLKAAETEDFQEGVSAFIEKRAPRFRGQ